MNKQVSDAEKTARELRRSSRNKLSTNRRRQQKVIQEVQNNVETCSLSVSHAPLCPKKKECTGKVEDTKVSPIKRLPENLNSDSPHQPSPIFEIPKSNSVTPKSTKNYSFTETPLKEDFFICSQHFDPNSDVAWDCRSPDAINILKKGNRRRHHSDVSSIITQLHVCNEEEEQENTNTTPLLGLWINENNNGATYTSTAEQKTKRGRNRRSKIKQRLKPPKGNDSLSDALVEKLKLVLEKCEGNESQCEEGDVRKRSASVGDESKDLFESQLGCDDNQDDESWSDDDLFEDDSFIIKATQVETQPKGYKRKLENDRNEEPPVKSGKYKESDRAVVNLPGSRFTIARPSPFKKHRSFNDRHEYEKEKKSVVQNASNRYGGKNLSTNATISQQPSKFSSFKQKTTTTSSCVQNDKQIQGNLISNNVTGNIQQQGTVSSSNQLGRVPVTQTGNKINQHYTVRAASQIVTQPNKSLQAGSKPLQRPPVSSLSVPIKKQVVKAGPMTFASKKQDTNNRPVSTVTASKTIPVSTLTKPVDSAKNTLKTPCSRRASGAFDTSLSDDLLCQIVEPDEILESQVYKEDNLKEKKTSHIDDALSFFHEVPSPISHSKNHQTVSISQANSSAGHLKQTQSLNSNIGAINSSQSTHTKFVPKTFYSNPGQKNTSSTNTFSVMPVSTVLIKPEPGTGLPKQNHNQLNMLTKIKQEPHAECSAIVIKKEGESHPSATKTKRLRTPRSIKKTKTDQAMENASEDLFLSDDDELSEQQMWEVLDNVESTQISSTVIPERANNNSRTGACVSVKQSPSNLKSPVKYQPEEIERKRLEALRRKHQKEANACPEGGDGHISCTPESLKNSEPYKSPVKYSPEEIERKRLEALKRKQQREATICHEGGDGHLSCTPENLRSSQSYKSPFKCSPDEIQRKRLEALKNKQHRETNHCQSNDDGHLSCTPETPTNSQSIKSPFKCSPDEIEKKRLEALKRKQQRELMASKATDSRPISCSPQTPSHSKTSNSPFKCSPEDIEKKRNAALKKRQLKFCSLPPDSQSTNNINIPQNNQQCVNSTVSEMPSSTPLSPLRCSQEEIENKKKEALKRLQSKKSGGVLETVTPIKSNIEKVPMKCSPEDIEKKRQAALIKRQQKSDSGGKLDMCNSQVNPNSSPFRCSPENITEIKTDNAHCKKLNFDRDLKGTTQSQTCSTLKANSAPVLKGGPAYRKTNLSAVSAEEIERKKQLALQKRQEKLKNSKS